MNSGGYTIEVTCLSPKATEKYLHDFLLSVVQLSMLKLPGKHYILDLISLDLKYVGLSNSCFFIFYHFIILFLKRQIKKSILN